MTPIILSLMVLAAAPCFLLAMLVVGYDRKQLTRELLPDVLGALAFLALLGGVVILMLAF